MKRRMVALALALAVALLTCGLGFAEATSSVEAQFNEGKAFLQTIEDIYLSSKIAYKKINEVVEASDRVSDDMYNTYIYCKNGTFQSYEQILTDLSDLLWISREDLVVGMEKLIFGGYFGQWSAKRYENAEAYTNAVIAAADKYVNPATHVFRSIKYAYMYNGTVAKTYAALLDVKSILTYLSDKGAYDNYGCSAGCSFGEYSYELSKCYESASKYFDYVFSSKHDYTKFESERKEYKENIDTYMPYLSTVFSDHEVPNK